MTSRIFALSGFELAQPKTGVVCVKSKPSCAIRLISVEECEVASVLLSFYSERFWQISFDTEGAAGFDLGVRFDKDDLLLVVLFPDLGIDLILSLACDRQRDVKLPDVSTLECNSIAVVLNAVIREPNIPLFSSSDAGRRALR